MRLQTVASYTELLLTSGIPAPVSLQPSGAHGGGSGNHGAANGSSSGSSSEPAYSLFAFPAYDNFSGKISPAEWVKAVQAKSTPGHQWKVRAGVWRLQKSGSCMAGSGRCLNEVHTVELCSVPEHCFCASWLLGAQVIWDTAAYAPCHPINLAEVPADFICLSL